MKIPVLMTSGRMLRLFDQAQSTVEKIPGGHAKLSDISVIVKL